MDLRLAVQQFFSTLFTEMQGWSLSGPPFGRQGASLIVRFREAGAVSRATAQRFRARTEGEAEALRALLWEGIIHQEPGGRFWLDEQELVAFMYRKTPTDRDPSVILQRRPDGEEQD